MILRGKEILPVFLSHGIYQFGNALISIFIPIYLVTLGYTIDQALLFLAIRYLTIFFAAPASLILYEKTGIRGSTITRIPCFIAYYLSLYALASTDIHYAIPAILSGISGTLYWMPLHSYMVHASKQRKRSGEVGVLQSVAAFVGVLAPSIGGIVAAIYGFPTLVLLALVMISLSSTPLFFIKDERPKKLFSWKTAFKHRKHPFSLLTIGDGVAMPAAVFLFPLYMYTLLQGTEVVGYIKSLARFTYAVTAIVFGHWLDRNSKLTWVRWGAYAFAATIIARVFFTTVEGFAFIIFLGAVSGAVWDTSYVSLFYMHVRQLRGHGDEYIVTREWYLSLARAGFLITCVLLPDWRMGFFVAGGWLALSAALTRKA